MTLVEQLRNGTEQQIKLRQSGKSKARRIAESIASHPAVVAAQRKGRSSACILTYGVYMAAHGPIEPSAGTQHNLQTETELIAWAQREGFVCRSLRNHAHEDDDYVFLPLGAERRNCLELSW